jgi:hypothetical protein
MKTCTYRTCTYPVFGGGYCKNHQWIRKYKEIREGGAAVVGISPLSVKKAQKKAVIAQIKRDMVRQQGCISFFTGRLNRRLDAFHIFPIGKFPEYETERWNIVLAERWINGVWDQGTWDEIQSIPNVQRVLDIIIERDSAPDKKHCGSFYEMLQNRKGKI